MAKRAAVKSKRSVIAPKRGRKPKSAIIEADEPQKESISVPEPEPLQETLPEVVVPDLPDDTLFDEPPVSTTVTAIVPVESDLPAVDEGLTPAQKLEFARLVRKNMPLTERAERLAALGRLHGTKTAAVGLRAIVEMNRIDGFTDDASAEVPPMFAIPEGSQVAVAVKIPKV